LYLLLSEIQSRNDFARKEIIGNAYLRPLRQLWADIPQLELTEKISSFYSHQETSKLKTQINKTLKVIEKVQSQNGNELETAAKLLTIKKTWKLLSSKKTEDYSLLKQHIDDFRAYIGDQSNLILDPDLDTYYLMDATLLTLPQIQATLVEIQSLSKKVLRGYQATPTERANLIILLGNLNNYNQKLKRNMDVAFNHNPLGNLRPNLLSNLIDFTNQVDELTQLVESIMDAEIIKSPDVYFLKSQDSLKKSFILWDKIIVEQDLLLQHRINGFVQRQIILFILVLIILSIALYLFIGFYLGVKKTVDSLSIASKQMVNGNIIESISLTSRDELAEVVKSFNNIAVALVKANHEVSLLNQRLETENFRMSAELQVTSKLQQMILPKDQELSEIRDLDIAGYMKPADEVGGDYYDVLQQNGCVKIGIGDVTGHGLESGVLMIMVQTAVRTLLENNETDPKKFLSALNRTIYQNVQRMNSDKNLTLSLLDYKDGTLRVSGQHEEMIVVRQGGELEKVDTIDLGFPIGLEADITDFIAHTNVVLNPGDVVVLYTDGITEAENINGVQYGLERLTEIVKQNHQYSAHQIRHAVISDVRSHIGEQKVFDDITLLVLKQKSI
jgi:sigma-B regulation protein RsbU (phosphoserine phosphatase)